MENVISAEMLQIEGSVPTIGANFEEFKVRLETSLSQYEMAVTEENVGDAKKMATSLKSKPQLLS